MGKKKRSLRPWCQAAFTALSNGYWKGFGEGKIWTGNSKHVCVPGLNCYSCPGALGACPIGSLQAVAGSRKYSVSLYVFGLLMMFGAVLGRFVCGWLCPFGLVQDLLHKIPFPKKLKKLPGDRVLRWLKYAVLLVLVILLPTFAADPTGQGQPWFCKYVCPSGTLFGGVPLTAADAGLAAAAGWLFRWKLAVLIGVLLLSVAVWRPFCRYLCPLGAIYAPFNRFALLRFRVDREKCTRCGACRRACKMDLPVMDRPNSPECVRCGACRRACPTGALRTTLEKEKKKDDG